MKEVDEIGLIVLIDKLEDEIRLIPIPDDPVEDLRKVTDKLKGKSIDEMKKGIKEEALESMG